MLFRTFAVIASTIVLTASAALAQAPPPAEPPGREGPGTSAAEGIAACRADMRDLCSRQRDGRGARMHCLLENRDRVSPACAGLLAAIDEREPRGQRRPGRFDDRDEMRDRGPNGGRAGRFDDRRAGPPDEQRGFGRKRFAGGRPGGACRDDAQSLCGTAQRGPERRQCLRDHEAQLSEPCREALSQAAMRRRDPQRDAIDPDLPR